MNDKTKERLATLVCRNNSFDYILSHTAPLNYEPRYLFLSCIDQNSVDKSMENFLQWIYENINYNYLKKWFFGHHHDDNLLGEKVRLLYNDIIEIE